MGSYFLRRSKNEEVGYLVGLAQVVSAMAVLMGAFIRLAAVKLIVVIAGSDSPGASFTRLRRFKWRNGVRAYAVIDCVRVAADGSGGVFAFIAISRTAAATLMSHNAPHA
jgi:hypothetical protein